MTAKEKAKVTHDINNVYHAKYKGKSSCYIRTHSNEPDSPAYVYRFRNHVPFYAGGAWGDFLAEQAV